MSCVWSKLFSESFVLFLWVGHWGDPSVQRACVSVSYLKAACEWSLTLPFCFYFNKNISVGGDLRDHLVQPPYFTGGGNWDPERNWIYSGSHSELMEEDRLGARPLVSWLVFFRPLCRVPCRIVPSILYCLAASPLHTILHVRLSVREFVHVPWMFLMVKISLNGGENIGMNSVLSLPLK